MILNGIPDNIKNKFQLDFGSMLGIWNMLIFISRYVPTERNILLFVLPTKCPYRDIQALFFYIKHFDIRSYIFPKSAFLIFV
ncbi:hypothetical protein DU508_08570 [Pedobacter chinensis]|uniref:Uncharacterized protein n=1 Tax=Pedobacter chinensis TaxID=2282421 RepID=A0A369PXJ3_9SPHI|nr:hypothetical protein DU508_08570 [Pedobacter chinensis]